MPIARVADEVGHTVPTHVRRKVGLARRTHSVRLLTNRPTRLLELEVGGVVALNKEALTLAKEALLNAHTMPVSKVHATKQLLAQPERLLEPSLALPVPVARQVRERERATQGGQVELIVRTRPSPRVFSRDMAGGP